MRWTRIEMPRIFAMRSDQRKLLSWNSPRIILLSLPGTAREDRSGRFACHGASLASSPDLRRGTRHNGGVCACFTTASRAQPGSVPMQRCEVLLHPVWAHANFGYLLKHRHGRSRGLGRGRSNNLMKRRRGLLLCAFVLLLAGCGGGGIPFVPSQVLSVTVTPGNPRVPVNGTQQFTANVTVQGNASTAVNWSISPAGVGSIDPFNGLYTAPASVPTPATVTVTATSIFDRTKSGLSSVTITIGVVVTPAAAQILIGTSRSFTAVVQGSTNQTIDHWTVNGITNGDATVGTITVTGPNTADYTAPCTQPPNNGSITIGAVPVADPTLTGSTTALVNTPAQQIVVTPAATLVVTSGTRTFTANTAATPPNWLCGPAVPAGITAANWSVTGGGSLAAGCTGTTSCDFTAPTGVPFSNAVTIKAALPTDASRFGTATATIDGPITITGIRPRSRTAALLDDVTITISGTNIDSTARLFSPQTPACSGPPLANSSASAGSPPTVSGTLPASNQSTAGTLVLSVCNSSNNESATVPFVLVDALPAGSTGTPAAVPVPSPTPVTGIDVMAVDDAAVGAPSQEPLNQEFLGVAPVPQNTTCPFLVGGPVTITRPSAGTAQFVLCAGRNSLTLGGPVDQYTVSLSGPNPPDILVTNPPTQRTAGSGGIQTTLTVPSNAAPGARTFVIRDTRSNLAVAAGGVIIK